jgi:hypothetical protein
MARFFNLTPKLTKDTKIRLACAGGLLAIGMTTLYVGAEAGIVHVNAGDMNIVFGHGDDGLKMDIAARTCPPHCGFDINWRPLVKTPLVKTPLVQTMTGLGGL